MAGMATELCRCLPAIDCSFCWSVDDVPWKARASLDLKLLPSLRQWRVIELRGKKNGRFRERPKENRDRDG